MNFSHFVRTDWLYRTIIGFASLCCTTKQSATRLEQNTARLDNEYTCGRLNRLTAHYFGYELLAIGYWLLAMGYWLLGIGYGQLVIGYLIWAALSLSVPLHSTPYTLCSMLYTLRFTLIPLPLHSTPYALRFTLIPLPLHSTPYALHFTLKATATMPLTFRLIAL